MNVGGMRCALDALETDRGLTTLERLVLLILAERSDYGTGENAYPSASTIAALAGCHRTTVPGVLRRLDAAGYIERTGAVTSSGVTKWRVLAAVEVLPDTTGGVASGNTPVGDLSATCRSPVVSGHTTTDLQPQDTTPLTPLKGGRATGSRRGRARTVSRDGHYDPDTPLDTVALAAYSRMGIELAPGATRGDAEAACASEAGEAA